MRTVSDLIEVPGVDLSSCAREPIHLPSCIQGHGALLCLDQDLNIVQASANLEQHLGIKVDHALGAHLSAALPDLSLESIGPKLRDTHIGEDPVLLDNLRREDRCLHIIAHQVEAGFVLEFEPADAKLDIHAAIRKSILGLKRSVDLAELAHAAAQEVRSLTGFDRVLFYQFDADYNGHVIGEDRTPDWGSYLDLWFPASDIPAQARKLYEINRQRLIVDSSYQPVPLAPMLNPKTGAPLDMSFSLLRSVSPVHLEYLRNMGVASSMSISILTEDGRLWGLIACHHRIPKLVGFQLRTACDMLAHTVASRIAIVEQRQQYERSIRLKSITSRLLHHMAAEEDFLAGLNKHPAELLSFARASGAALLYRGTCTCIGACPSEEEVLRIVDWLLQRGREDVYATDSLPESLGIDSSVASGVLAISISKIHRSYVLWFRPEVQETVTWGGDPRQPACDGQVAGRLHPRSSFETWKQIVRGRSLPWDESEIEAASELRNAVVSIVLRKAEEVAQITEELQRSNRELEAFSYSVSHDLRAPFRHIVGYAELLKQSSTAKLENNDLRYLDVIIDSAQFAGTLVDNLLSFSQVGRAKLNIQAVPMSALVRDVVRDLETDTEKRSIDWRIGPLPEVQGDLTMLRLVWQNLLHNAIKYTRKRDRAVIDISADQSPEDYIFSVKDNGAGFEQKYVDKLFGVFQRLHKMEDYEGTGIGLANVRRIVSRHGGKTWAEGELDRGAAFYFTLPVSRPKASES